MMGKEEEGDVDLLKIVALRVDACTGEEALMMGNEIMEEDVDLLKIVAHRAAANSGELASMISEPKAQDHLDSCARHPNDILVAVVEAGELGRQPPVALESIPGAHHVGNMNRSTNSSYDVSDDEGSMEGPSVMEQLMTGMEQHNEIIALEVENESPNQTAFPMADHTERSTIWYFVVTCILLATIIVIVVGSICGVGFCSPNGSETAISTSMVPSSYRHGQFETFKQHIVKATGPSYFEEDTMEGPQGKALQWIVFEDPLWLEPDDKDMLQRFALAAFYFATTQRRPWSYCNPPQIDQTELCIYLLFEAVDSETRAMRWLSGTSVCQWAGVFCKEGVVSELRIIGFDVHGLIPRELTMLTQLTSLYLNNNSLSGSMPLLPVSIQQLHLRHNQLTGTIPASLFQLSQNLTILRLSNNLLTGSLPSEVGLFAKHELSLDYNQLTGSLSSELLGLEMLKWLFLDDNNIHGTISSLISTLSSLKYLHLGNLQLTGSLPSEVALLHSLVELGLARTGLQGSLPEILYTQTTNLVDINLDGCQFSGTLSTQIGLMTNLNYLEVANNNFFGVVPIELALLQDLRFVTLNGNNFTGTFPEEVCLNLPVKLDYTVVADCTPDQVTGVAPMNCSCCTQCCEPATGICSEVLH